MGRKKIHATPGERAASYRDRLARDRQLVKDLRAAELGELPKDSAMSAQHVSRKWFQVEMCVDREESKPPCNIQWIMEEKQLLRFQHDLYAWQTNPDRIKNWGTYAYAGSGLPPDKTPGTASLCYDGVSITQTEILPDFEPHDCYAISEGVTDIIVNYPNYGH